jgi:hypothetical protein
MTTSGTYVFDPEIAEVCDEAFERCGVDPTALINKHVISARRSLSYVFTTWATRGITLWTVAQNTTPLVNGNAAYSVPQGAIAILDAVVRDPSGIDTVITPISRTEYFAKSNKVIAGVPNEFWYERIIAPIVHTYPVINTAGYSLIYNYIRQIQDPGAASNTLGIPAMWQEAIVAALAAKLAEKYSPEREAALLSKAEQRFKEARQEDRERHETEFVCEKYRGR